MKLVILSNRIPYTFSEGSDGFQRVDSAGGLITALDSLLVHNHFRQNFSSYRWYGCPGNISIINNKDIVKQQLLNTNFHPIFIEPAVLQGAYSGFCNRTLWPLFHEFPLYTHYNTSWWNDYVQYNLTFFNNIKGDIGSRDIIWIHDYHLLLVPMLLRKQFPDLAIGFFLHIPFPRPNYINLLPITWRAPLLESLLTTDLVGFQTQEYQDNFTETIIMDGVKNISSLKVGCFPIGIDYNKVRIASLNNDNYKYFVNSLNRKQKIILSVSRLDYTKGLEQTLNGYERFLIENEYWREKVSLVLLVVPSRLDNNENAQILLRIEQTVGRINGRFSNLGWNPVFYTFRHYSFEILVSLYKNSDIALVTSLRDGMNLVSKEFIASQSNHTGVLILSKLAGAANELKDSLLVNPYNEEEVALAIKRGLEMDSKEQEQRLLKMQKYLAENDVTNWGLSFIESLRHNYNLRSNLLSS